MTLKQHSNSMLDIKVDHFLPLYGMKWILHWTTVINSNAIFAAEMSPAKSQLKHESCCPFPEALCSIFCRGNNVTFPLCPFSPFSLGYFMVDYKDVGAVWTLSSATLWWPLGYIITGKTPVMGWEVSVSQHLICAYSHMLKLRHAVIPRFALSTCALAS